jgi:RimJ/RimL family protein N-acetyltransferase
VAELPFPAPPLSDDIVRLRPWRDSDVAAKLAVFRDPDVHRFAWPLTTTYTEADARRSLVEKEQARRRGEELGLALVEPLDDGIVLGGGSLHAVDLEQGRAAVGYELAPAARGRGVATRAVRLIARWAFEELGIARLELTCGPDNHASMRVAERCGFTREGLLRSHMPFKGGRRDTVVFGLLPGELR